MPQILRQDGVPFVVYTYRELVAAKKTSLLKKELHFLAREHGDFTRFYAYPDGDYEAVFSREPGYLLGENIWQHFGNPLDLLYCEQLEDSDNALLVVIRDGTVYLDAELPIANLMDEFINLIGAENQYDVYIYGDIPLAKTATETKFAFEPEMLKSFNVLPEPVFPTLEADEALKLIPFEVAILELPTKTISYTKYIIFAVFVMAVGYGIWKTMQDTPAPKPQVTKIAAPIKQAPQNPYQQYITALSSPSPSQQMTAILGNAKALLTVPGWTPKKMTYDAVSQKATYTLENIGGDAKLLLSWVKENNVNFSLESNKATIVYNLDIPNRSAPTNMYNLRDTVALLYDGLHEIFPDTNISFAEGKEQGIYRSVSMTISFKDISFQVLYLLASALQSYPVVMQNFSITSINEGIMSGSIQLQVLGAST